jgi:hypothetical protein
MTSTESGWYALVCTGPHHGEIHLAPTKGEAWDLAYDLFLKYDEQVDIGLMLNGKQTLYGVFRPGEPYKDLSS